MKNVFLTVTVFIASVSSVKSQTKLSEDQKAVQHAIRQTFEALSDRDSVALREYCASDIQLFEYGKTWTLDTLIIKAIKNNKATDFKRINTIDFINTTVDKNVAWATYNNQADIAQNNTHRTITWIETVVLVREKKKWKIKVLHSTFLKKS